MQRKVRLVARTMCCHVLHGGQQQTSLFLPFRVHSTESFSQGWLEPRNRDSNSGTNFSLKAGLVRTCHEATRNPHTRILPRKPSLLTHKPR